MTLTAPTRLAENAVTDLVASFGTTEAAAADLDRLAQADETFAASTPPDAWGRRAYAVKRAVACRAAAGLIRACIAS